MHRQGVALAAVLAAGLLAAVPARAGRQDFFLVNRSSTAIAELHLADVGTTRWREDVLGMAVLRPGAEAMVAFPDQYDGCHFDLKLVFQDGAVAYKHDVDLCRVGKIVTGDETAVLGRPI